MNGVIEIHGGSVMFANGTSYEKIHSTDFIAGDKVAKINGVCVLVSRTPQSAIGFVQKNTQKLHIPTLLPFSPKVVNAYEPGTRLLIWLNEDGTVIIKNNYSSSAVDDAKIINDAYCLTTVQSPQIITNRANLYTRQECVDHDDLETFTIDPENSKDFDDAISVTSEALYIHIVDIAKVYQSFGSKVIDNLRNRCFTLYLENEHTEHLLDSVDSTNILSLVKGERRNVITVKVKLDEGIVTSYEIYRSTIVVKYRYNYDEVQKLLNSYPSSALKFLKHLALERSKNVTYNINLPSLRITSDVTTGVPTKLVCESTNDDAHNIVATAMVLGNLIVSKHLSEANVQIPNRFHDSLRGILMPEYETTNNSFVDSFILVKRYSRACYSVDKKGHFGLGITDYVHFTSPMRRYADVIIHLLLAGMYVDDLESEVQHINYASMLNRGLQDLYKQWKLIRWLAESEKKVYETWVTGLSPAGVLWYIPEISQNGFTHVSQLEPSQRWIFQGGIKPSLNGPTHIIHIGQKMTAHIVHVDMDTMTFKVSLTV